MFKIFFCQTLVFLTDIVNFKTENSRWYTFGSWHNSKRVEQREEQTLARILYVKTSYHGVLKSMSSRDTQFGCNRRTGQVAPVVVCVHQKNVLSWFDYFQSYKCYLVKSSRILYTSCLFQNKIKSVKIILNIYIFLYNNGK